MVCFWKWLRTTLRTNQKQTHLGQHFGVMKYTGHLRWSAPWSAPGIAKHSSMCPWNSLSTYPPVRKPRGKESYRLERVDSFLDKLSFSFSNKSTDLQIAHIQTSQESWSTAFAWKRHLPSSHHWRRTDAEKRAGVHIGRIYWEHAVSYSAGK